MPAISKGKTLDGAVRQYITTLVDQNGFSQNEIAKTARVNQPTLSGFMSGRSMREPNFTKLLRALRMTGCRLTKNGVECSFAAFKKQ